MPNATVAPSLGRSLSGGNTAVPTSYNNAYVPGGAWLTPTAILAARWVKGNVQVDF